MCSQRNVAKPSVVEMVRRPSSPLHLSKCLIYALPSPPGTFMAEIEHWWQASVIDGLRHPQWVPGTAVPPTEATTEGFATDGETTGDVVVPVTVTGRR